MTSSPSSPPPPSKPGLTYREAGVDIDAGNQAVERIRRLVASTRQPGQLSDLGGFAGMMGLPTGMAEPVLVSCTDGVGTKLLVAIAMDRHDTVGIDLVAMNVNDLLVTGASPLFVLDYIACAKLVPTHIEAIVAGIAEGCRQSQAALLGGETAELPGLYAPGHYDLAAFAVGVVDRAKTLGPHRTKAGDVAIALASSGLHSNGYGLARKALLDPAWGGLALDAPLPHGSGTSVGEALLTPTKIYASTFRALHRGAGQWLHAAAHITGGGLLENPPRAYPDDLTLDIDLTEVECPPMMRAIADIGVAPGELHRTFNCGIGMLLFVDPAGAQAVLSVLADAGEPGRVVGSLRPRTGGEPGVRVRHFDGSMPLKP